MELGSNSLEKEGGQWEKAKNFIEDFGLSKTSEIQSPLRRF